MLTIDQECVQRLLDFGPLVEAIGEMFVKDCIVPVHRTVASLALLAYEQATR